MKVKTVLAAALALFLGYCSCLMPLADAASTASKRDHSCCPSAPKTEKSSDCCMRAAIPPAASLTAPKLVLIGLLTQPSAPILTGDGAVQTPRSLSPPGDPFVPSRPSRAPPVLA